MIFQYKYLIGKDQLEFTGSKITSSKPITNKVEKGKGNVAGNFNIKLYNLCESDLNLQDSSARASFACRVQQLIETPPNE